MIPVAERRIQKKFSPQSGYTLLELLVVMTIMVLGYTLLSPIMFGKNSTNSSKSSVQKIVSDLRALKTAAILQGDVMTFEIIEAGQGYKITGKENVIELPEIFELSLETGSTQKDMISFYPDGTNSDFKLYLKNEDDVEIIKSEWPTGRILVEDGA